MTKRNPQMTSDPGASLLKKKQVPKCSILEDLNRIENLSHSLGRTMRRLRRDIKACQDCASADDCDTLRNFNAMVKTAIDEVNQEWEKEIE